jgi:hypothetical protein
MVCILNQPKLADDPAINKLRNAMIHRALWMGLLLKEMKDRGLDWEQVGHAAVLKTGLIQGEATKDRMDVAGSLVSFGRTFFNEDILKVFEIEVKTSTETELKLEYGHCPLVTAWQRLGIEGEMLAKLCDIAMSGDRGVEKAFDEFEFTLGRTIAQGHPVCEVSFTRRPGTQA